MSICKKPIKLYSKSLHCPAVTVQCTVPVLYVQ